MKLTEEFRIYAQKKYLERKELLGELWDEIETNMQQLPEDEKALMQFIYGTMPLGDAGEYPFSTFYSFASHAMFLRNEVEWCRNLPEDIFIHHVFYYRIGSENLAPCRPFFYEELKDRIKGMTMREAVLSINYWCFERATYSTTDGRTMSPLALYYSGRGRCGEEAVFSVTALRSVGIPAREVYTPRWAHCDDNHAWVEALVDGTWHFFGACEPEEELDRGWFEKACGRAAMINSSVFSDYAKGEREECIGQRGPLLYYNCTPNYTETKKLQIRVVDEKGQAVEDAHVSVQVLNYSEYCGIVGMHTDKDGKTGVSLGRGDFRLWATKDGKFGDCMARADEEEVTVRLDRSKECTDWADDCWHKDTISAPQLSQKWNSQQTAEQKKRNQEKMRQAELSREARREGYYKEELAAAYEEEKEILKQSIANFDVLCSFLGKDDDPKRKKLLHVLAKKDTQEITEEILEDYLRKRPFAETEEGEEFEKFVLNPRIFMEELTPYVGFIQNYFPEETKEAFAAQPKKIMEYIEKEIQFHEEEGYRSLCPTPIGMLRLKEANGLGRKLLFIAICRALGIPARMDYANFVPEYKGKDGFEPVEDKKKQAEKTEERKPARAFLTLLDGEFDEWSYYRNLTVGRFEEDHFVTLGHWEEGEQSVLTLEPGIYRVLTTVRLPDGSQNVMERVFTLAEGEKKEITLERAEGTPKQMMISLPLPDVTVKDRGGNDIRLWGKMEGCKGILAFLEEGKEPTEHVLNELMAKKEKVLQMEEKLLFVVRGEASMKNRTLHRILTTFPHIEIFFDPEHTAMASIAESLGVDQGALPLTVAFDKEKNGIFCSSGYHIGNVELTLNILEISDDME